MYRYISHKINDNQIKYYYTVDNNNQNCRGFDEISYAEFIHLLKSENNDFLMVFFKSLNDATDNLSAYFWECVPVSQKLINKKFEFVVTKSEELNNITLDSGPFAKHLADIAIAGTWVGSFPNKGKDAVLIIPSAKKDYKKNIIDYKNISQFTKNASQEQKQKFWQEVANRLSRELEKNEAPKWLSTHGLGVPYLHVRIDNRPKYYHFEEYKTKKNQQENNAKNDKLTPIKEEALDNKQDENKGSLPLKNDNNNSDELEEKTSQNLDKIGLDQKHLANSFLIEQENAEKASSQKDKLLLIGGTGVILLIGIVLAIWWKWKKDKTNQK